MVQKIIMNLHMVMTIYSVSYNSSHFEVSTILIFMYTKIYLAYFLSIVYNKHSVEVLFYLFIFLYGKI
jgi:hypothetical protein